MQRHWLCVGALATVVAASTLSTGCSNAPPAEGSSDAGRAGDAGDNVTDANGQQHPATDASTSGDAGRGQEGGDPGTADSGIVGSDPCGDASLVWNNASKTTFTSYPAPGSAECIQFNGCQYEGQFQGCSSTQPLTWVQSHNIVAVFPNFNAYKLHDLCLRSGTNTIVVTAYDTCADSDCSGCCTQNAQPSGNLIDVESFTDARWGVDDGQIEFADLGPTSGGGCN
jgi:hypothetical protein